MIQFNLLPDVKLEFVRVNRIKRMVLSISIIASTVSIILFGLLFSWDIIQKHSISSINQTYASAKSQLQSVPNLNSILTIQNQLQTLPSINSTKPVVSRLFGFLSQITPTTVSISSLDLDFSTNKFTIGGVAGSIADVNTFADTLKFTTFTTGSSAASQNAFTNVVLSSFSVSQTSTSYSFSAQVNPALFISSNQISQLNIPPEITTRSIYDQPKFTANPLSATTGGH